MKTAATSIDIMLTKKRRTFYNTGVGGIDLSDHTNLFFYCFVVYIFQRYH